MRCPGCDKPSSDRVTICAHCGFHFEGLAKKAGRRAPPRAQVLDTAGVLDEAQESELLGRIATLHEEHGVDCAVVAMERTAPLKPAEMAFWLLNQWSVGGPGHRGLLVLLALEERRIEVEVGYGLEPLLSDEAADAILDRHVVPRLAAGELARALDDAVAELAAAVAVAE